MSLLRRARAERFPTEREHVLNAVRQAGPLVLLPEGDEEPVEVELATSEAALAELQKGYSVHGRTGRDLTRGKNAWKPEWLVIGTDALLGDPYFVDLRDPEYPVYTAMHGAGRWHPDEAAPSLVEFLMMTAGG